MKSKTKSVSGESRVRLTLKDKRDVIAKRKLGLSRETIEETMGKLSNGLWKKIWRERDVYEKADCNLKDFNTTHKKTDNEVRKMFDSQVLTKIITKTASEPVDYACVKNIMQDVQKKEEFQTQNDLQKLVFSDCFINRFLTKNNLLYTDAKSDQKTFSEDQLRCFRAELAIKLSSFKPTNIFNCDETSHYNTPVKKKGIRLKTTKAKQRRSTHRFTLIPVFDSMGLISKFLF